MSRSPMRFAFLPLPALLALLIGFAVNFALFLFVGRIEDRREESQFQQLALRRFGAIEIGVSNAMEAGLSINRWFETMDDMTDVKFSAFVEPVLQAHPYFVAFGYQAVVRRPDRAAYEARIRRYRPGFAIRDELRDGPLVAASPGDAYRVIEYIHPRVGNELLPGFNTARLKPHNEAAARASESGRPASTRLFGLLQFDDRPQGFLVFSPVHRKPTSVSAHPAARREIIGYTVAAFLVTELFHKILAATQLLDDPGIAISLYAGPPNPFESLGYAYAGPALAEDSPAICRLYRTHDHEFSQQLRIADALWRVVVTGRTESCVKTHAGSLLLLVLGTITTLMAATYLTVLHRRALQLAHVNARLRGSEERFRHLLDMSSDWYWEQDAQLRFTMMAGRMVREMSGLLALVLGRTRWEIAAPGYCPREMAAHRALVESHQPFHNFEYPVQSPPDKMFWVSVSGEPLFGEDGVFLGYRGTSKDISERKRAELGLRQLTAHREAIKEQERKRIAREIHDDLGQTLLALRLDVAMLHARTPGHARIHARASLALQQIDSAMTAMRALINDLRPPVLDLGIDAAIEWQVRQFSQRTGIGCDLVWDSDAIMLDERIATALFRIVQESLNNVLKHASASRVQITLSTCEQGLTMRIVDDGVGAQAGACSKPNAFGLAGIGERVFALRGSFDIITSPGQGMELIIHLPARAGAMETSPQADALSPRFGTDYFANS